MPSLPPTMKFFSQSGLRQHREGLPQKLAEDSMESFQKMVYFSLPKRVGSRVARGHRGALERRPRRGHNVHNSLNLNFRV